MKVNRLAVRNVLGLCCALLIMVACSSRDDTPLEPQNNVSGQELFEYRVVDAGGLAELEGGELSIRTQSFFQGDVTKQGVQLGITLIENGTRFSVNEALGSSFISSNRLNGLLGTGNTLYDTSDAVFRSDGSILLDVERRQEFERFGSNRIVSQDAQIVLEPLTLPEGNILERSPQFVTFAFSADSSDDGTPVSGQLILTANPQGNAVVGALQINEDERLAGKRLGGQTRLAIRGDNDPDTYDAALEFGTLGAITGDFGSQRFTGDASLDEGDLNSILDDTYTGTFTLGAETINWTAVPDFRDLREPVEDPEGSARFDLVSEVTDPGRLRSVDVSNLQVFASGELFVPQLRVSDPTADPVDGVLVRGDCRVCERPADLVVDSDGQAFLTVENRNGTLLLQGTGTLNPDGSVSGTFSIEEDGVEGTFTATPE